MAKFTVKELPYAHSALAPAMSEETLQFHHDKHYAGYVNKLNELIEGTEFENKSLEDIILLSQGGIFNNAAQAWNHEFFFDQFSASPKAAPEGKLAEAIVKTFGSVEEFQKKFAAAAVGQFGSGWAWLCVDKADQLVIKTTSNASTPLTVGLKPILCFDVWEHAYYIDYRNRRPDAMAAWWKVLDWTVIENRF